MSLDIARASALVVCKSEGLICSSDPHTSRQLQVQSHRRFKDRMKRRSADRHRSSRTTVCRDFEASNGPRFGAVRMVTSHVGGNLTACARCKCKISQQPSITSGISASLRASTT